MKEDKYSQISKKVRNKLIYYTYLDIKNKTNNKNCLLINSMTSNELNDKYQKCSDYCVEKIEIYSNSQSNGIDNNNYFHISVTYYSANNNYHVLVDNKNVSQYIGNNNIVGKYYKGNTIKIMNNIVGKFFHDNSIQIGNAADKIKYNNVNIIENQFEKKVIGEKKFFKQHRNISSLDITKNLHIIDNENNNEINEYLDNLKSNYNERNRKKLNSGNKIKKTNTQKNYNKYMIKLKKYCSNLIKIQRKINTKKYNNKMSEPSSTANDKKRRNKNDKNDKNDKNNFRSGKDKPIINPSPITKPIENYSINYENNSNIIPSESTKLKSQTKINQNIVKTQVKSSFRKHKSIEKFGKESASPKKQAKRIYSPKKASSPKKIFSPKKSSPKKIYSPKKSSPPKKIFSPKNIYDFNSGPVIPTSKFYRKFNKKEKEKTIEVNNRKYNSRNKNEFSSNKRKKNAINNSTAYFRINNNNEKIFSSTFRGSNRFNKNENYKKSLTINKMYKLKAGEKLEKKINTIKLKENK